MNTLIALALGLAGKVIDLVASAVNKPRKPVVTPAPLRAELDLLVEKAKHVGDLN